MEGLRTGHGWFALNKIDIPDARQVAAMASGDLSTEGVSSRFQPEAAEGLRECIFAMASW